MTRLSYSKRLRIVTIYIEKNLKFQKGRFHTLKVLASEENIIASVKTFRRIVMRWLKTG